MPRGSQKLVVPIGKIVGYIVGKKEPCKAREDHESPGGGESWVGHTLMCLPVALFFI